MLCPLCGKPVPAGAAFCPSCGAAMRPPADRTGVRPSVAPHATRPVAPDTAPSVAADFDSHRRRNQLATFAGALIAATLAAVIGVRGFLLSNASSKPMPLQAHQQGTMAPLDVSAHSTPAPLLASATVGAKVTMPDDIRDYLEHVRRCEAQKVAIASKQNAEATVLFTKMKTLGAGVAFLNNAGEVDPGSDENKDSPPDYGKDKILNFRPEWDQLVTYFNSKQPPTECQALASNFNTALSEVSGMMGDVSGLLNDVMTDPARALQKANSFQGKSYDQIDPYFGKADDDKNTICAKYGTKPWFEIKKNVGGDGMLSAFGSMGGGTLGGASVPGQ